MTFLSSVLGRNKKATGAKPAPEAKPSTETKSSPANERSQATKTIYILDGNGREAHVTTGAWQKDELANAIKQGWNDANRLYEIILDALAGGSSAELVDAARHLFELEPKTVRAVCAWGIVLRKAGRLEEAEKVLSGYLSEHPKDIVVLTNLAKVQAERKAPAEVERTLWRVLEVDPNHLNALDWLGALTREGGGAQAELEALRRVAALTGSWRAQLWLARNALASNQLMQALSLYSDSLAGAGKPAPVDLLLQMSGDLGEAGRLLEILQFVEPLYDPAIHGLEVANNVIKANVDLGRLRTARVLLDQLIAQNRSEWSDAIQFWDAEIQRAKQIGSNQQSATPRVAMLTGRAPLWLRSDSHFADLFPEKATDGAVLCFLGGSVSLGAETGSAQARLADAAGQLSRALPLFLAEQVELGTTA